MHVIGTQFLFNKEEIKNNPHNLSKQTIENQNNNGNIVSVPLHLHKNMFFAGKLTLKDTALEKFTPIKHNGEIIGYDFEYAKNKKVALYPGNNGNKEILWIDSSDKEAVLATVDKINCIKQQLPIFESINRIQYSGDYITERYFRDLNMRDDRRGKDIYELPINEDNTLVNNPQLVPKDEHTRIYSGDPIWNNVEQYKYGPVPENNFYVLRPEPEKTNGKLLIYVHGGGFFLGSAVNDYDANLFKRFLEKGYTVATIDYRLMKTDPFCLTIEDVAKGIKATHNKLKFQSKDIVLSGLSSGAVAGALLLYSDKYPSIPKIGKFIGLAGGFGPASVADFLDKDLRENSVEHRSYRSLLKYGDKPKTNTPALLLSGAEDECDKAPNSDKSRNAQLKKLIESSDGGKAELFYTYENYKNHGGPQQALIENDPPTTKILDEFLEKEI
jgi:acetyl esterase/lipase